MFRKLFDLLIHFRYFITKQTSPLPKEPSEMPRITAKFRNVLDVTFKWEGGYVNHPDDPGGMTNRGITARVYAEYLGHFPTEQEMRKMPKRHAQEIYLEKYWTVVRGPELPNGVDMAVFDFAVNSGPSRAIRYLQERLHVQVDGKFGPVTMAALLGVNDIDGLIDRYCDARGRFFRRLKTFPIFGEGWMNRLSDVRANAHKLARK